MLYIKDNIEMIDSAPKAPENKFTLLPVALVFALVILTIILPDLIPDIFVGKTGATIRGIKDVKIFDVAFVILAYFLLLFYSILCVVVVLRRKPKKFASYLAAALLVFASIVFAQNMIEVLQIAKIAIFRDQFRACAISATKYSDSGAFNICSAMAHGNSILTVVYDSGKEIELPASQRSKDFTDFIERQIGPVMTQCDVYSRPAFEKFYLVTSVCG